MNDMSFISSHLYYCFIMTVLHYLLLNIDVKLIWSSGPEVYKTKYMVYHRQKQQKKILHIFVRCISDVHNEQ